MTLIAAIFIVLANKTWQRALLWGGIIGFGWSLIAGMGIWVQPEMTLLDASLNLAFSTAIWIASVAVCLIIRAVYRLCRRAFHLRASQGAS